MLWLCHTALCKNYRPYTIWHKERDLFPHSYGDKKSKNEVLTGGCSEVTLLAVQVATFSLCSHVTLPLRVVSIIVPRFFCA